MAQAVQAVQLEMGRGGQRAAEATAALVPRQRKDQRKPNDEAKP